MDSEPNQNQHPIHRRVVAACFVTVTLAIVSGCSSEPEEVASAASKDVLSGEAAADAATANISNSNRQYDPVIRVVRIVTGVGEVTVKLDAERAPGTVQNFLNYVSDSFYDGTLFHYVAPGEMIVGGGYTVDGQLKPTRLAIRNEAHNGQQNVRGSIAMARDPSLVDSATSQFFINLSDAPQLDHAGDSAEVYGYCVFGQIVEGMDVVEKIASSPIVDRGGDLTQTPQPAIVIQSIRVIQ